MRSIGLLIFVTMTASASGVDEFTTIVYGVGKQPCGSFVQASDQNIDRVNANRVPGTFTNIDFQGDVVPYVDYVAGAIQGYQEGRKGLMAAGFEPIFFEIVKYCRENPVSNLSTSVGQALHKQTTLKTIRQK